MGREASGAAARGDLGRGELHMGMDLIGRHGRFHFSIHDWWYLLELAKLGGWEPAGTLRTHRIDEDPCTCAEWRGGYHTNDYQRVTAADALAMAEALERMLPSLPNEEVVAIRIRVIPGLELLTPPMSELDRPNATPTQWFGGSHKAEVEAFIQFCRHGEFLIS
jgi:hypothetical protein